MMGYLDRTWCPARISSRCSRSQGCYRVFTPQDQANAEEWWGGKDFPLSCYLEEPECFVAAHDRLVPVNQADGSE